MIEAQKEEPEIQRLIESTEKLIFCEEDAIW